MKKTVKTYTRTEQGLLIKEDIGYVVDILREVSVASIRGEMQTQLYVNLGNRYIQNPLLKCLAGGEIRSASDQLMREELSNKLWRKEFIDKFL